jgi:hypothetical protein
MHWLSLLLRDMMMSRIAAYRKRSNDEKVLGTPMLLSGYKNVEVIMEPVCVTVLYPTLVVGCGKGGDGSRGRSSRSHRIFEIPGVGSEGIFPFVNDESRSDIRTKDKYIRYPHRSDVSSLEEKTSCFRMCYHPNPTDIITSPK